MNKACPKVKAAWLLLFRLIVSIMVEGWVQIFTICLVDSWLLIISGVWWVFIKMLTWIYWRLVCVHFSGRVISGIFRVDRFCNKFGEWKGFFHASAWISPIVFSLYFLSFNLKDFSRYSEKAGERGAQAISFEHRLKTNPSFFLFQHRPPDEEDETETWIDPGLPRCFQDLPDLCKPPLLSFLKWFLEIEIIYNLHLHAYSLQKTANSSQYPNS